MPFTIFPTDRLDKVLRFLKVLRFDGTVIVSDKWDVPAGYQVLRFGRDIAVRITNNISAKQKVPRFFSINNSTVPPKKSAVQPIIKGKTSHLIAILTCKKHPFFDII